GGEGLPRVEVANAGVGANERFLCGVARFVGRADQAVAEPVDGRLVLFDQAGEGGLVAAGCRARPFRLVGGAEETLRLERGSQRERQCECRIHENSKRRCRATISRSSEQAQATFGEQAGSPQQKG